MKISDTSAVYPTLQQRQLETEHNLQNVFSDVLSGAGHAGYASAEPIESEEPIQTQIQESWDGWFQLELQGRYRTTEQPRQLGKQYGALVQNAYENGGYIAPKAFLSSLSPAELSVVQDIHHLAEPIQVNSLTEEGAINLLIPPPAQIDMNRDGLTQSGAAWGLRFPDSTTPKPVAEAFETATEGMDWGERSLYELQMVMPTLLANFHVDQSGAFAYQVEPGDPRFVNPRAAPDYSYVDYADSYLSYLDAFKSRIDPIQYTKGKAFWTDFQNELIANK
ncbi:hypothetical protein RMSM_01817 [Rhodopirellula maiorica SM1]|uniref:Uncharacterized protein n=1 Tax=Rhodopirellula maiorica SM1 TaxID=1265738 RepID=M5S0T0_9BACT|nr:hypothetical protein [Rhodopirellula maiorica]EMI21257.1 hypothetical protein RMSM_01817 [Rhodopirellula maiorica SM1]